MFSSIYTWKLGRMNLLRLHAQVTLEMYLKCIRFQAKLRKLKSPSSRSTDDLLP